MPDFPKKFIRAQTGVAAIEFALLLPLLILIMLGSFELQRYLRIERQLTLTAENIAAMVAQRQSIENDVLNLDYDIAYHTFPAARDEPPKLWWHVLVHQISGVIFTPTVAGCTKNCTYAANLTWNWPTYDTGFGLGALRRQCGPITPTPDSAQPTGATLPASMFGPGSMIAVDLRYEFKPLFGSMFMPTIILSRRGYANARFASPYLKIVAGGSSLLRCPGY
jgi:Flp pilus assembly pilin Flp